MCICVVGVWKERKQKKKKKKICDDDGGIVMLWHKMRLQEKLIYIC